MTQRLKNPQNNMNLETIACERYMSRLLQRAEKSALQKPTTYSLPSQKYKDRTVKQSSVPVSSQNQLTKGKTNVRQQNLPSPKNPPQNVLQYTDEAALVEVTVKTTNPRQKSKSTAVDREPWSQLLKQNKSNDKISVFSNFDPLRTLHFLAKELQYQLQSVLPDDNAVQQMVCDMQYALKRVPPEVASTIHLQQAIDSLPKKKSATSLINEKPEKLKLPTSEKSTQTPPLLRQEETERLQKVMEESTVKLEASCRQMEIICEQLKKEKGSLESQLQTERDNVKFLKKRIEDLEFESNEILTPKIASLEEDKRKLESTINDLTLKIETKSVASVTELRTLMTDLKNSKTAVEQECSKLKHQVRLCSLEKEKYIAVLALRDRQINEIRNEMTQLQEVVNDQLIELQNNAFAYKPSNPNLAVSASAVWNFEHVKENGDVGDGNNLPNFHNDNEAIRHFGNNSFKDLPSGDTGTSNILLEMPDRYFGKNAGYLAKEQLEEPPFLDAEDSQASIRNMFSELKKTAFALSSNPRT